MRATRRAANLQRRRATRPVQVGRHLFEERVFLYGEVGFVAAPGKDFDDEWFYGVAAEWDIFDQFVVLGEINGSAPTSGPGYSDVVFNLGFKWEVSENLAVLAAMGRSFRSDGPDLLGFWGLQLTF